MAKMNRNWLTKRKYLHFVKTMININQVSKFNTLSQVQLKMVHLNTLQVMNDEMIITTFHLETLYIVQLYYHSVEKNKVTK